MIWRTKLRVATFARLRALAAVCAWLGVCLVLLWPSSAFAGDVVVAEFEGAKPEGVRDIVVEVITELGHEVESSSAAPSVDPTGSEDYFVSLAQGGGYKAFVTGYTDLKNSGWTTSVTVRDGATGGVIGKVSVKAGWYPGLQKALKKQLPQRLEPVLARAKALGGAKPVVKAKEPKPAKPAKKEPEPTDEEEQTAKDEPKEEPDEPEEEEPSDEEPEEEEEQSIADDEPTPPPSTHDRKKKDPLLPALDLDVGGLMVYRKWRVQDPLSGGLDGALSPLHYVTLGGARASLGLYPVAFTNSKSFARHIGLEGSFGRSFVGDTVVVDAATEDRRKTTFQEIAGGLRVRIPAGDARFGVFGGAGMQKLVIAGEKRTAAQPDANYTFYRAGADAAIGLVKKTLTIEFSAAYRGLLKLGDAPSQIQSERWFPEASGAGVDGRLEIGYLLGEQFMLRLGGTGMRYVLAFDVDPDSIADAAAAGRPSPPVAGGAVDWYACGDLSIAWLLL